MAVQTLDQFMAQVGTLSAADRELLVDQATVLIERVYVHLPLKRAMHAVDPVQRLRNLRVRMGPLSEREFHDELIAIFTELRDLHTNYVLPAPYADKIAFLPFLVEECQDAGSAEPRHLVTKLFAGFTHPRFGVGAEIIAWSGVPIDRAVEVNSVRQAGSNLDARRARGLEALTLRDMGQSAPPDERWVVVTYVPAGGGPAEDLRFDWRVFQPDPAPNGVNPDDADEPAARVLGYDAGTEARRRAKKALFNQPAMEVEAAVLSARSATPDAAAGGVEAAGSDTESSMPDVFSFKTVTTPSGSYGYLRIWTFMVGDTDAFLAEAVRILELLPPDGLIVDVRGNGGGNLLCAEGMLQLFTPRPVAPTLLSFLATPLTLEMCSAPVAAAAGLDQWRDSLAQAGQTGAAYSQGLPVLPLEEYNTIGQRYQGPVVLITDALCYSATDMLTAGFRDNGLGPILGTAGNVGAGGANVWTHAQLLRRFSGSSFPFRTPPSGATFRVSFRRTTRQGAAAGTPIEDLGIMPDAVHRMTRRDVLNGNVDLLAAAGELVADLPARRLTVTPGTVSGSTLTVTLSTRGIDRADLAVDGRPVQTVDVNDGTTTVTVRLPVAAPKTLGVAGFSDGALVVRAGAQL